MEESGGGNNSEFIRIRRSDHKSELMLSSYMIVLDRNRNVI